MAASNVSVDASREWTHIKIDHARSASFEEEKADRCVTEKELIVCKEKDDAKSIKQAPQK